MTKILPMYNLYCNYEIEVHCDANILKLCYFVSIPLICDLYRRLHSIPDQLQLVSFLLITLPQCPVPCSVYYNELNDPATVLMIFLSYRQVAVVPVASSVCPGHENDDNSTCLV